MKIFIVIEEGALPDDTCAALPAVHRDDVRSVQCR